MSHRHPISPTEGFPSFRRVVAPNQGVAPWFRCRHVVSGLLLPLLAPLFGQTISMHQKIEWWEGCGWGCFVGARPLGLSLSITPLYLTKIPLFNTRAIVCRSVSISGEELVQASPPKFHPRKTVEKSLLGDYRHRASTKSGVLHTQLLRRTFMKRRMQPGVPKWEVCLLDSGKCEDCLQRS